MKKTTIIAATIIVSMLTSVAQGAILARDEFEIGAGAYTGDSSPSTGSPSGAWLVNNSPATTGFTGAWSPGGNQWVVDSDTTLSIPGRVSAGGMVASTFGGSLDPRRSFDAATQSALGSANDIWFSVLMRTTHTSSTDVFRLYGGGTAPHGASIGQRLNGVQVKLADSSGATGGGANLTGGGSTTLGEAFTQNDSGIGDWDANTSYLLVGHLTMDRSPGGVETLEFWKLTDATNPITALDPNSPFITTQRDIFDTTNTGPLGVELDKGTTHNFLDSFRIGTGYIEIVSDAGLVPEPSSLALLVVGAMATYLRRRR